VRKALQSQGHDVFTPTLTGLADRSHLLTPDVDLDTHILDVVNLIQWEELSDVVLCGHSYAGCVVTGVADRIPERVGALVYLDAFILEDGECQIQNLPPERVQKLQEMADSTGEGWKLPPTPAAVFKVNENDRAWVDSQCTMQPFATFRQPIRLSGGIEKIGNVVYVLAEGFREGSPFRTFYEKAQTKGYKTLTVQCGHDVMVDEPEELTRILLDAAGEAESSGAQK
jgi:pimeloyl-ACP methyl ester carboxylesterase